MLKRTKKKEEIQCKTKFPKNEVFDFNLIGDYFSNKEHSNFFQIISEQTCKDLDFLELFKFVDRTNSRVGQQYLYNELRVVQKNKESEKCERIITLLNSSSKTRHILQTQLSKLNNDDAYYIASLFQKEHVEPPKWLKYAPILSATSILSMLFIIVQPNLFFITLLLCTAIINLVFHFYNKRNLLQYINAIPELIKLNRVAKNLFNIKEFTILNPQLKKSTKTLDNISVKMSFFKLDSKFDNEILAAIWGTLELIKILLLLEPILLFSVLRKLDAKRSNIEEIFSFVGKIDTLASIASLRKSTQRYCIPDIINGKNEVCLKEVYHPLIHNCIKNTINIEDKSILLTGSNMSGKTTFIRTIGVNVILAQTINTCFATECTIPDIKVHSSIRITDDLMNEKSYFLEEVHSIKEHIAESSSGQNNLFLLDEVLKGTNTIERIACSKAVLSELNKNNTVLVSTHDIELAELLKNEYDLYYFTEQIHENDIVFDYKLNPGKLPVTNAIKILEINNLPESLINEAYLIKEILNH